MQHMLDETIQYDYVTSLAIPAPAHNLAQTSPQDLLYCLERRMEIEKRCAMSDTHISIWYDIYLIT